MIIVNHTLAFALEVLLLVLLGRWASSLAEGPWLNWAAVLLVLAVAIGLWWAFAAPNSPNRLQMPALLMFKIAMFGAGTAATWAAGQPFWALAFGLLSAAHLALAVWLDVV